MTGSPALNGLQIESPLISPQSENFRPPSWPPPRDFPVVIDAKNMIISRYGDSIWDFSPWAGKAMRLNFGDGKTRGKKISRSNANLFRAITGNWLWGVDAVQKPGTLKGRHELLKTVFVVCTEAGILGSDLYRYPRVIEKIAKRIVQSKGSETLSMLNRIWGDRESLGFTLLDEQGLKQFTGLITERDSTQTAYIPPRIWTYKMLRLKECLDDYIKHQKQIEACYKFCLGAYLHNAREYQDELYRHRIRAKDAPFNPENAIATRKSRRYYGPFRLTAKRFGIDALLGRWVNTSSHSGIKSLSSYLSLISKVGLAYVVAFSLMRVDEATTLRANCYEVEEDPVGEDIHMIRGVTTKTSDDEDARWIVTPTVELAIKAMTSVARLRLKAGEHDPDANFSKEDISNPYLQCWAYEPWAASTRNKAPRKRGVDYSVVIKAWPKLFSESELTITKEDLDIARQVTMGLDPERFAVGKIWPLTWHQDRRTGAVNMLVSGLVSENSLQYQLKHASRAMSRYYGQNYYKMKGHFDDETRGLYLREMYQSVARQFQALHQGQYVSPYGKKRKDQILAPISEIDHDKLVRAGKAGNISYRENFLGGCAKPGAPCGFGGISNISNCMGHGSEGPCEHLLIRLDRRPRVVAFRDNVVVLRKRAPLDSMQMQSFDAQIEAAERALDEIDSK